MKREIKLSSTTEILESLEKYGKVHVSFDGGFSSHIIKDFAYFTELLNKEQKYYGSKIFFDHQESFKPYYFVALNGRKQPDLSNDKSLD